MSDISGSLLARKIASIEASGADTLVATDVSCLLHIEGGLRRKGSAIRVRHLAEVMAEGGEGRQGKQGEQGGQGGQGKQGEQGRQGQQGGHE